MADAMMMFLGEAHGVNWYWAQPGEFENPGAYYWDGAKNVLCVPHLSAPEAPAQNDPMDTPLPCDVRIGNGIHRKGTSLRTLVNRAQRLHEAAFGPAPTKEEAAANLEQLRSAVIAPAQASAVDERQPLTPERVDELSHEMVRGNKSVNWLVRAIERAHGIGDSALAQKGGDA